VRIYGCRPVLIAVRHAACSPTAVRCRASTRRKKACWGPLSRSWRQVQTGRFDAV